MGFCGFRILGLRVKLFGGVHKLGQLSNECTVGASISANIVAVYS